MSLPASPEQRGQQAAATPCTPCTPCTPSTPQVAPRAAVELDAGWAPREGTSADERDAAHCLSGASVARVRGLERRRFA